MNSLIFSATTFNNIIIDLVLAAIIVLYFLWGFLKGCAKPVTAIISWGLIILIIYFGGVYLGNLFLVNMKLEAPIRNILASLPAELNINVDQIVKYIGLTIASICVFVVIKLITFIINIVIKKSRKPYKKALWSRFLGAFLNIIKGALWIYIILAILYPIAVQFEITEIVNIINNSSVAKFLVGEYNPINLLVNLIVK